MIEVYTTTQDYCYLVQYAHSGNEYYYFRIENNGDIVPCECLNNAKRNPYYLDYLSQKQLKTIYKFEELFKKTLNNNDFTADDIPF